MAVAGAVPLSAPFVLPGVPTGLAGSKRPSPPTVTPAENHEASSPPSTPASHAVSVQPHITTSVFTPGSLVAPATAIGASVAPVFAAPSQPASGGTNPSESDTSHQQAKRLRVSREGVRRGKWTTEEQTYADRLIRDFEAGILPLENGATLRAYLSKKLNCDPMRISKKFAGSRCLGKQIFLKRPTEDTDQMKQEDEVLRKLEESFLQSICTAASTGGPRRRNRGGGGSSGGGNARGSGTKGNGGSSAPGSLGAKAEAGAAAGSSAPPKVRRVDSKLSSSDEGETDGSDTDNDSATAIDSGTLSLENLGSCCQLDIGTDDEDSLVEDAPSMLVIEDIREAMNSLSAEGSSGLQDLNLPLNLGRTSVSHVPAVASSNNLAAQAPADTHEDLVFMSVDMMEPLGDFLPDECFEI
eukprot:CAMPEP_0118970552 /NCGR_PEP_ID=MMETSP1173-20130426/7423_1 /TAXON_ID=1034831 /ORGANISM="Rhizochromulina marina cf, Strain CCMP1243" /LENGTH=411 /DNA_ID=CAMNT_0006919927 /DNA_START=301 /DNA_END=1536 /DNA_ORIENTATION=+